MKSKSEENLDLESPAIPQVSGVVPTPPTITEDATSHEPGTESSPTLPASAPPVKEAADEPLVKEKTDISAKYKFVPKITLWALRWTRDQKFHAVKVNLRHGATVMTESVVLDPKIHWRDERLVLPQSYKPYAHLQHFILLPKGTDIQMPDGKVLNVLEKSIGFEVVSDPKEGRKVISIEDAQVKKCLIAEFDSMRSNFSRGELPKVLVNASVAPLQTTKSSARVIFGGPLHGKTTAMVNGLAIDVESHMDDKVEFFENQGLEFPEKLKEWQVRWDEHYSDDSEAGIKPGVRDDAYVDDLYAEGAICLLEYTDLTVLSHLNSKVWDYVVDNNVSNAFLFLDWIEMFDRATDLPEDEVGTIMHNRRAAYATTYYQNITLMQIEGPFYTSVEEAIQDFDLGAGIRDQPVIQPIEEET